ncbi:MAG: ATPase [Pontixanthobacter sp.]
MTQIALPLMHRGSDDPGSIILGNANAHVADALRRPDDWPYRTAILRGGARSGKSLFGRWFAASGGGAVIDGADRWDEAELFHRWNAAQDGGGGLLLISDADGWNVRLPDLASRVKSALHMEIREPDDAMAAELMQSMAQQRGLALGEGAPAYLVPRTERSFAGIERTVIAIDRLTLERKVPATMGIWRDAIDALHGPEQTRLF